MSHESYRNTPPINGIDVVSTTEMGKIVGFPIGVAGIKDLGIKPFYVAHVGTYWKTSDVPLIAMAVAMKLIDRAQLFQIVLNEEKE